MKIFILWKKLPQQSIRIFICSAFPAAIRIGKITAHRQRLLKFLKTGKLFAVIKRHCLEFLSRYLLKDTFCRRVHIFSRFVFHFCDHGIPAFAFHMADDIAAPALAGKRVRFPVANASAFVNNLGTFVNRTSTRYLPFPKESLQRLPVC